MMPSCDQIGVPIHFHSSTTVQVCFLDELAHSAEGLPAPVPEFGDSFRDQLQCRRALARARLFHVLVLEVPEILNLLDRRRTGGRGGNQVRIDSSDKSLYRQ